MPYTWGTERVRRASTSVTQRPTPRPLHGEMAVRPSHAGSGSPTPRTLAEQRAHWSELGARGLRGPARRRGTRPASAVFCEAAPRLGEPDLLARAPRPRRRPHARHSAVRSAWCGPLGGGRDGWLPDTRPRGEHVRCDKRLRGRRGRKGPRCQGHSGPGQPQVFVSVVTPPPGTAPSAVTLGRRPIPRPW